MTDFTERQSMIVAQHWETALKACVADGVPVDFALRTLAECSYGGLKGVAGSEASKKEILRIRDDIWAELTLLADRCGPAQ